MNTMLLPMSDGSTLTVEYVDFACTVQDQTFALRVHRSVKEKGVTVISTNKGMRVTSMLNASCNLQIEVTSGNADKAMRDLIKKYGAARVRSTLAGAQNE